MFTSKGYGSLKEMKELPYSELLKMIYFEDLKAINSWNSISKEELLDG
jgi:hypothetical protein